MSNKITKHEHDIPARPTNVALPVGVVGIKSEETEPIDVLALSSLCEDEHKGRQKIVLRTAVCTGFAILIVFVFNITFAMRFRPIVRYTLFGLPNLIALIPQWLVLKRVLTKSQEETDALKRLTDTTDIRALGALFHGQDTKDVTLSKSIQQALLRLLPLINRENANILTERDKLGILQAARHSLNPSVDEERKPVVIACIRALAEIGGAQAIASLKEALKTQARTERQALIRAEVVSSLAALGVSLENEKPGRLLLRSASPNSDGLLQPVEGNQQPNPDSLVRASDSNAAKDD